MLTEGYIRIIESGINVGVTKATVGQCPHCKMFHNKYSASFHGANCPRKLQMDAAKEAAKVQK